VLSKADVHVHTKYSGFGQYKAIKFPESTSRPEDVVDIARKLGLRVLCVTDHNSIKGGLKAREYAKRYDDIEVVVGAEMMTSQGEVIALFIEEDIPKGLTAVDTIERIRAQNGLAIAPHPFSRHVCALGLRVDELDIDALETINGGHLDGYANAAAKKHAESGRWAVVGGSDAHSLGQLGCAHTAFPGETAEDFRKAILAKTTTAQGKAFSIEKSVQWSVQVVLQADILMMKSFFGMLESDDPDDPLIKKINTMKGHVKLGALISSMIFLAPPIPFLTSITGLSVMKRLNDPKNAPGYSLCEEHH